jgi:hypothetical protein
MTAAGRLRGSSFRARSAGAGLADADAVAPLHSTSVLVAERGCAWSWSVAVSGRMIGRRPVGWSGVAAIIPSVVRNQRAAFGDDGSISPRS